jgi:hypothetical protein
MTIDELERWLMQAIAGLYHRTVQRGLSHRRNRFSHHVLRGWKGHPWSPSPHDFGSEIIARLHRLLEV